MKQMKQMTERDYNIQMGNIQMDIEMYEGNLCDPEIQDPYAVRQMIEKMQDDAAKLQAAWDGRLNANMIYHESGGRGGAGYTETHYEVNI